MPTGRSVQVAVVIFLVILIILLTRGYATVSEAVVCVTISIATLVISTAIDNDVKRGGGLDNIKAPDEVPDCCAIDEDMDKRVEGMGESIDFEKVLAQKIKSKRSGKKDKTIHAHQEACKEVLTALTGQEFIELSASKPKPKGEHVVATKDHLPEWYKTVEGNSVYLDMDGWNAEERLGFEYRGPVHDQEDKVKENDAIKERLAKEQNLKLMILHYGIPANLMTRYIYTRLIDWKVPMPHGLPRISKLSPEQMTKLDWNYPKRIENLKNGQT